MRSGGFSIVVVVPVDDSAVAGVAKDGATITRKNVEGSDAERPRGQNV